MFHLVGHIDRTPVYFCRTENIIQSLPSIIVASPYTFTYSTPVRATGRTATGRLSAIGHGAHVLADTGTSISERGRLTCSSEE